MLTGTETVSEQSDSRLVVRVPVAAGGVLVLTFDETGFTGDNLRHGANAHALQLDLALPHGTPGTHVRAAGTALAYCHEGFAYTVEVAGVAGGSGRGITCRGKVARVQVDGRGPALSAAAS